MLLIIKNYIFNYREMDSVVTEDDILALIIKEFHLTDINNPLLPYCTNNILSILKKSSQVELN